MTVLKKGLSFEDAGRVMDGGGYVRQSIWHFRRGQEAVPTAMTKVGGVFVVCVAPGKAIHKWDASMPEVTSADWEHVEF